MPVVGADAEARLSTWEVSVDFVPPEQAHLQLFLDIRNTGAEGVSGVQLGLAADGLEYIETEKLTFDDEETSDSLEVTTEQEQGKSLITLMFPRAIEQGQSEQILLDFNAKGLLNKEGDGYVAAIHFDAPKMIRENGDKVTLNANSGSFRIHVPEAFVYTNYNPIPWREIWQGVSGFRAHFILIFNGGTPLTTPITVSFKESQMIKRATELYGRILDLEAAQDMPQEKLDEANRRITEGANYVIFGEEGLAKIELDKAESILTGEPIEDIISRTTGPTEAEEPFSKEIYMIGIGFIVLVLVILIFGKKIISALTGGKKDDE